MKTKLQTQKTTTETLQFAAALICFFMMALQGFAQNVNRSYTESFEDFMNPDRGFYYPYDSEDWYEAAGVYKALNENTLRNRRTTSFLPEEQWDPQGNIDAAYNVKTSIILRHFVLDDFTTSDISPAFLNKIQTDFDRARNAGVRIVLRFSYAVTPNAGNCSAGFNCPPYGDASRFWVERHIDQLTDYLRDNEDVIMAVQQGFIGTWGEQYYTDHFGDASGQTDGQTYLDADNWRDRIEVLKKLLDAVPVSRMVQVRYPQMKIKFLQRYPTYANRIGFQNDCFLSSQTDVGTFVGYDQNDPSTLSQLRNYANNNGDFVAVGGETCGDSNSEAASYAYNNCENNGGSAVTEMALMNYSFINSAYSYVVNNDWVSGGCIDEIKRRLGYRIVLKNGQYPPVGQKGTTVNFSLNLDNVGFAAPFNERKLFMLLKNGSTYLNPIEIYGDGSDIRTWRSGNHNLNLRFDLPANINVGNYEMYLHIADLSKQNESIESVRNNPVYSIRLGNNGLWDANTGYNKLNHTISIQNTEPPTPEPEGNNCVEIDGNFDDWQDIVRLSVANNPELSNLRFADDAQYIYIHLSGTLRNHYQIFLDTDGNRTVSNYNDQEYLNSDWPQTGFNYMIENGTLVRYFSDNPWTWPFIGSIQQRVTGNGLELIVPKNLLGDLSNSYINIAANTLDASWTGTAYLPANSDNGASYQLYSSSPCVETDVCILIDGDGSEWQTVGATYTNNTATLKTLKVADNAQDLFVYFEGSLSNANHTPQIFFDTDNNVMGSNEFRETDWPNTGFNYMMEFNTLYKYIGSGTSWEWQPLGQITIKGANGGNNTLEMKIPKSQFNGSLSSTIKVAGYYYNSNWSAVGVLPSNSNNGVNYVLGSNNSCGTVVQKIESDTEAYSNTKYNLNTSLISDEIIDNSSNKKTKNNCITVDGNHGEWNAMNTYGYAATGSLTHIKVADNSNEILFYLEGGLDVNNQIYINSDVNNTNLNRYTDSQWEYAGFNYLIENEELFVYNGDGIEFVWSSIGPINYSISDNVLEIAVQKNQLSNLSSSISFAATSLNTDYHETGAIPNSNSALNYLLGTKNLCNIKPSCFNINGNMEQWLNINDAAQNTNGSLKSIKISDGSESLYILLEGNMDVHQQIFIDTDNDATGNNEYTDSNWSATGFNYLIDEGDLFRYQGDGVTWDWLPLGAVNMISSNYMVEVSIKKYLLGNIAGTVNIAASSFDDNWMETSIIPTGEQATAYAPSSNTLSLFFHQNGINFHQAYSVLESSANLINSNTNEVYKAGQLIQLNNGFSSPPLTNFSALIEACE